MELCFSNLVLKDNYTSYDLIEIKDTKISLFQNVVTPKYGKKYNCWIGKVREECFIDKIKYIKLLNKEFANLLNKEAKTSEYNFLNVRAFEFTIETKDAIKDPILKYSLECSNCGIFTYVGNIIMFPKVNKEHNCDTFVINGPNQKKLNNCFRYKKPFDYYRFDNLFYKNNGLY